MIFYISSLDFKEYPSCINNIKFTPREIDVLSGLLNGRDVKTIANLLAIAPSTVKTHIQRIKTKLNLNFKGEIIDFLEKSKEYSIINSHYLNLKKKEAFFRFIPKIEQEIKKNNYSCYLNVSNKVNTRIANDIKSVLLQAGIFLSIKEEYKVLRGKNLYIFCNEEIKNKSENVIFVSVDNKINYENCVPHKSYYDILFNLIGSIVDLKHSKLLSNVKEEFATNSGVQESNEVEKLQGNSPSDKYRTLKSKSNILIFFLIFFLFIFVVVNNKLGASSYAKETNQISNLPILSVNSLLIRKNKIKKIHNFLEEYRSETNNPTIAIVGIGGSGKTSLAETFISNRKQTQLCWKINAENIETIYDSLKNIAEALTKNNLQESIELKNIYSNPDLCLVRRNLLLFIQSKLKQLSEWILVFDNLNENYSEVREILPLNKKVWGNGIIFITSRDFNVRDFYEVSQTIQMKELTSEEQYLIYTKITNLKSINAETSKQLLAKLPPYPLAISLAAHYQKHYDTSLQAYIKQIEKSNTKFRKLQKVAQEEAGIYNNIFYDIIVKAIDKVIERNPEFIDIFIMISLINSENISVEILRTITSQETLDEFIREIKRNSLVETSKSGEEIFFSFQRNIHETMKIHLLNKKEIKNKHKIINRNINTLIQHALDLRSMFECRKLRVILNHFESIKNLPNNLLNKLLQTEIYKTIGYIYVLLGRYEISLTYLTKTQKDYELQNNPGKLSHLLVYLGSVHIYKGNYYQAEKFINKARKLIPKTMDCNNPILARSYGHMADIYLHLFKLDKALNYAVESVNLYKTCDKKREIAWSKTHLGKVYNLMKKNDLAISELKEANKIYRQLNNKVGIHWTTFYLNKVLGENNHQEFDIHEMENSYNFFIKIFGEEHIVTCWLGRDLIHHLTSTKQYKKAYHLIKNTTNHLSLHYGKTHPEYALILIEFSKYYMSVNEIEKSEKLIKDAIKILKENDMIKLAYLQLLEIIKIKIQKTFSSKEKLKLQQEKSNITRKIKVAR